MASLSAKTALVTGGGSGIGQATAVAFARAGANVVVVDFHANGGHETARMVADAGTEASVVLADVRKADDVEKMVAHAVDTFGGLDVAFNNAGVEGSTAPVDAFSDEEWQRVVDTNLRGVYLCMKHEAPAMLQRGGGAIVNCSSVAGLQGFAGMPAYVASKHGVVGLTRSAALDYAEKGIRVNAVCPGAIRTPMLERFLQGNAEAERGMAAQHPMNRLGTADEVAQAVLFLCSDAASFITGQALPVDGGWTIR